MPNIPGRKPELVLVIVDADQQRVAQLGDELARRVKNVALFCSSEAETAAKRASGGKTVFLVDWLGGKASKTIRELRKLFGQALSIAMVDNETQSLFVHGQTDWTWVKSDEPAESQKWPKKSVCFLRY